MREDIASAPVLRRGALVSCRDTTNAKHNSLHRICHRVEEVTASVMVLQANELTSTQVQALAASSQTLPAQLRWSSIAACKRQRSTNESSNFEVSACRIAQRALHRQAHMLQRRHNCMANSCLLVSTTQSRPAIAYVCHSPRSSGQ